MTEPAHELFELLSFERAALIRADFSIVDRHAARKQELLLGLEDVPISAPRLQKLRSTLAQNQTLITAAIAGITAAQSRIKTLNDVRSGLSTYDVSGKISRVEEQISGVNKCS